MSTVRHFDRRLAAPRVVFALMLREMVTTYGRSPGGYVWAILEPVAAIALLSYAFSLAFRVPSLGDSFPLFYATGYLPYMLFHDVSNKVAASIRFSRPLLSFGAVTYIDLLIARFLLNVATHLLVFFIVMSGLLILFETRAVLDLVPIFNSLVMVAVLAFGIGSLNCYLFTSFPVWERVWMVLTRPLFILSGVLFIFEDIPLNFRWAIWLNPIFHATGEMRRGFYAVYEPSYVSPAYIYGVAAVTGFLGMMLLRNAVESLTSK